MKIDPSKFDEHFGDFEDKWDRRDRKLNNRVKLKPPTQNKEKQKIEEKSLTKTKGSSIIEE